ncbi:hypothetical protein JTE90_006160 [Oedothorax gibbosus]|uniref:Amino acid transporter transmembrane domain-containing protein n=1 Tax=Oedothorax gibbosus TaxID=931172 RepID=A0AAV6U449_9ARAC|nr:hypothetical protein JTE90_006160 [Oedothorax gibbosus]
MQLELEVLQTTSKNDVVPSSNKGYSLWLAAVYIASFMAGMGILAMPHGLAGMGWYGVILISLACANSWYGAMMLGRCWMILEERWAEYRGKFRYPYPAIGMRAAGPWMRFAAIGALGTAALACVILAVALLLKLPLGDPKPTYGGVDFSTFSLAFGTTLFSFGGSFMCPTVHNDMKDRNQFHKASIVSFIAIFVLYVPVTVLGYALVGETVPPNILAAIEDGPLKMFVDACLAVHVFLAFLLAINPVAQEMEEVFNVPPEFNYKRCLIRSTIVGLVLLIGYAVPHFDKILNLIGGSTMTLLTFILPPIFYLLLIKGNSPKNDQKTMSLFEKIYLVQVIVVGIAGGISCTYFAVVDIIEVFLHD